MKKKLILLTALITTFYSFSQYVTDYNGLKVIPTNDKKANDVSGSPYLNETFSPAKITPLNKVFFVRYNAVKDEMEVQLEGEKVLILDRNNSEYKIAFNSNNNDFYQILNDNEESKLGYFLTINEGEKVSLFKKFVKKYHAAKVPENSYEQAKSAYYGKEKSTFYLVFDNNGIAKKLPTKRKAFISLFDNNKDVIKKYISQNKIKLNKEKDLIKVLSYINSL